MVDGKKKHFYLRMSNFCCTFVRFFSHTRASTYNILGYVSH